MQDLTIEQIKDLIANKKVTELRKIFEEYNSVDIADIINDLDLRELFFIFKFVPPSLTAEVFTYLDADSKERLIEGFSKNQINDIVDEIYTDDVVDFVEDLPTNLIRKVLRAVDPDTRAEINNLLDCPENSVGTIMNLGYVELKENDDCETALSKIRKQGPNAESISYCYVVDRTRDLIGYIALKTILLASPEEKIKDLMEKDLVTVRFDEDQEAAALIFKKYDMSMLPVVNKENKLIGVITADDILDVIEQETTEDIQIMSGTVPLEDLYLETSVFTMVRKRIVWLMILMVSAVFTGMIINRSEAILATLPALAIFMPMLNDTAGNAGNQVVGLVTRGVSINTISTRDWYRVLWKEIRVAIVMGAIMACASFGWMWLEQTAHIIHVDDTSIFRVVSLSMFIAIVVAKLIGGSLPILAKKCKLDPAIVAGPFVTTLVDALTVALYYGLANLLLL